MTPRDLILAFGLFLGGCPAQVPPAADTNPPPVMPVPTGEERKPPAGEVTLAHVEAVIRRLDHAPALSVVDLVGTWAPDAHVYYSRRSTEVKPLPLGPGWEVDDLGGFREGMVNGWVQVEPGTHTLTVGTLKDDVAFQAVMNGDHLDLVAFNGELISYIGLTRTGAPEPLGPPVPVDSAEVHWLSPLLAMAPFGSTLEPATCSVPVLIHPRGSVRVAGPIGGCSDAHHNGAIRALRFGRAAPDALGRARTTVVEVPYVNP